ncbi:hypothetical protein B296_00016689 [Ensete ventricosum]|uniref:Uncharacterized protein n=1 Tax=Ensete ventricosum TaxID=4639 RepID=A0A427AWF2_ENSVE|nr:hypothetical protein B296_00016689 [Ensete ventricosum]
MESLSCSSGGMVFGEARDEVLLVRLNLRDKSPTRQDKRINRRNGTANAKNSDICSAKERGGEREENTTKITRETDRGIPHSTDTRVGTNDNHATRSASRGLPPPPEVPPFSLSLPSLGLNSLSWVSFPLLFPPPPFAFRSDDKIDTSAFGGLGRGDGENFGGFACGGFRFVSKSLSRFLSRCARREGEPLEPATGCRKHQSLTLRPTLLADERTAGPACGSRLTCG